MHRSRIIIYRTEGDIYYAIGGVLLFLLLVGAGLAMALLHFMLAGVLLVCGLALFVAGGVHSLLY